MIVCSCNAVTDRAVRACIVRGDETPDEIGRLTRAGTDCGTCRPAIADLLDLPDEAGTPVPLPLAS